MFDRYLDNNFCKKSEEEIKRICEKNNIDYIIFYDELSYIESNDRGKAKFLIKDNVCIRSKMSS